MLITLAAVAATASGATAVLSSGAIGGRDTPSAGVAFDGFASSAQAKAAGRELLPPTLRPGSIRVDGTLRHYLISVPGGLHGPAPLVIAFHGLAERVSRFAFQSGLIPATRHHHEVLILPETQGIAFNDGRLGRRGPHDDAFAVALLNRYERSHLVDPERVTVAGFSNGAGMAMEIADAHPSRIAAVVSVDGEMIRNSAAPRPTGPVEAVQIHGTADRVQPWLGRPARGPDYPAYVSVLGTVDAWVRIDRASSPTTTRLALAGHGDDATRTTWRPGPSGAGVTFYRVQGMGHRWPVPLGAPLAPGDQRAALDATAIIVSTAATASREGFRTVTI